MAGEKARDRIGVGTAGGRHWELSPKELEQLLGRPRDEPFDGVGEDVGVLAVGERKLDGHCRGCHRLYIDAFARGREHDVSSNQTLRK
jgi:hypothetical protein